MLKFLGSLHSAGFAFTVNREAQPITRTESEAGCKYWHLVKQDDLNTGIKISSEVFLTRLLATKVCQSLTCTVCVSEIKMWNLKEETFLDNIFLNLKSQSVYNLCGSYNMFTFIYFSKGYVICFSVCDRDDYWEHVF